MEPRHSKVSVGFIVSLLFRAYGSWFLWRGPSDPLAGGADSPRQPVENSRGLLTVERLDLADLRSDKLLVSHLTDAAETRANPVCRNRPEPAEEVRRVGDDEPTS